MRSYLKSTSWDKRERERTNTHPTYAGGYTPACTSGFFSLLLDYNSVSLKNSFIWDFFFIKLVEINHGKKLLNQFSRPIGLIEIEIHHIDRINRVHVIEFILIELTLQWKGHGMLHYDCVTSACCDILLEWFWRASPREHYSFKLALKWWSLCIVIRVGDARQVFRTAIRTLLVTNQSKCLHQF